MGVILDQLTEDLAERQSLLRADRNTHTFVIKDHDPSLIMTTSFSHILKGIERKGTLVDVAVTVGRRVMQKLKIRRNSIQACHIGWFILVSYVEQGILEYTRAHTQNKKTRKNSRYLAYQLGIKNRKKFDELWEELIEEKQIDLFPTDRPPAHWTSGTNKDGTPIVKRSKGEILKRFKPESHQRFFNVLNKMGDTPWMINHPVFEVFTYYLDNHTNPSPMKFQNEQDQARRESLFIEASSIARLAKKHLNNNFYHLYNADFR